MIYRSSARIIYPPLSTIFFDNLSACRSDVILVAPYIKYGVAKRIAETLEAANTANSIALTLITNVSTANFVSGASDAEALEIILKRIPQTSLLAIGNLHAKCYLFDKKIAIITSGNLTPSGLVDNLELGTEIVDETIVGEVRKQLLEKYGVAGKKITLEDLADIRNSISQFYRDNAITIELLNEQAKQFDAKLDRFTSPRVKFSDTLELAKQLKVRISETLPKLARQPATAKKTSVIIYDSDDNLTWLPFEMARNSARRRKLSTIAEWRALCAGELPWVRPKNERVPENPHEVYEDEWIDWEDWLGTYLPFEQARALSRNLHLKDVGEWRHFTREHADEFLGSLAHVPVSPERTYEVVWTDWNDWLHGSEYLTFQQARSFVHRLQFRTKIQWDAYIMGQDPNKKPPVFIPLQPQLVYGNEWQDWNDWIGYDDMQRGIKYADYNTAWTFAKSLGLQSGVDWIRYCKGEFRNLPKKPETIPIFPKRFYRRQWAGMRHWVGAPEEVTIISDKSLDSQ